MQIILFPKILILITGGALSRAENNRIQALTDQDTQGQITTFNLQNQGSPNPYGGGPTGVQSGIQTSGFASDGGPVSNKTGRGRTGY